MSIDASAINEIFGMFPTDDPNPCEVLDELKQVKKTLDEWEEADDYIDTPDELSILVSGLREDYDEAEDRIEHLENEVMKLEEKVEECKDITMDNLITAEKEGDETLEEYVKRRIDKYILEGSLFTSDEVEESRHHLVGMLVALKEENEKLTKSLEYVRHLLKNQVSPDEIKDVLIAHGCDTIQEAVPPS